MSFYLNGVSIELSAAEKFVVVVFITSFARKRFDVMAQPDGSARYMNIERTKEECAMFDLLGNESAQLVFDHVRSAFLQMYGELDILDVKFLAL